MSYYDYPQDQTKAQIRSTRGETIDLALPVTCKVGELRTFLIEEYGYDANTRLLYNGLIADDDAYVCDFPFGSLMIVTPVDMQQPQRQALPPRQAHNASQSQNARGRVSPRTSPRQASATAKKDKAPAKGHPADLSASPDGAMHRKNSKTVVKHPPKNSPRAGRSTSAESNGSPDKASKTRAAATPANNNETAAPLPPVAASASVGSGKPSPNRVSSARSNNNANSARSANNNNATQSARSACAAGEGGMPSATANPVAPPPQQQTPAPAPQPKNAPLEAPDNEDSEEVSHRQRVKFTVEAHIPSLKKVLHIPVNGEASVADVAQSVMAQAPEVGSPIQVVLRGKVLPQLPHAKLFDLGIRANTRVFIAAGEYSNPETITLLEIEEDTAQIDRAMQTKLTDLQRKGYYEELMRILFRTDGLQSLDGEWRQRRKDAVKHITSLQDALGIEGKAM